MSPTSLGVLSSCHRCLRPRKAHISLKEGMYVATSRLCVRRSNPCNQQWKNSMSKGVIGNATFCIDTTTSARQAARKCREANFFSPVHAGVVISLLISLGGSNLALRGTSRGHKDTESHTTSTDNVLCQLRTTPGHRCLITWEMHRVERVTWCDEGIF